MMAAADTAEEAADASEVLSLMMPSPSCAMIAVYVVVVLEVILVAIAAVFMVRIISLVPRRDARFLDDDVTLLFQAAAPTKSASSATRGDGGGVAQSLGHQQGCYEAWVEDIVL